MIKNNINTLIRKIKGIDFENFYLEIKKIHTKNDLNIFQETYLKKLLRHASEHIPYYNHLLKHAGVVNNGTVDISNFKNIPILTKEVIRTKKIISDDCLKRKSYYNFSGGSTGEPLKFLQDSNYYRWYTATLNFYYNDMINIDEMNAKKIELWGSPRDILKGTIGVKAKIGTWLSNTILLNSFRMTETDMQKYVKTINSTRPNLIRGYTNSLYELCRFIEKNKLQIYKPDVVICSAEVLTNNVREKIESVFKTKLYNFYGSRETASLAGECKNCLMHIFEFNNHIEILDQNNQPAKEGQEGRIIVTNLHNYSMPFIRYEIGDMAVVGPDKCKCGSILPTLERIEGRIEEQFIKKNGDIVIGYYFVHLLGVVLNKGFIKKFQVIQEDYDKIRILVIPNKKIPDNEKKEIENGIKIQMGFDCKITWDYVDDISKTNSGKYLYTKSFVARE